ncbi:AAA family ATPase [Pseudomonas sp. S2_H08]
MINTRLTSLKIDAFRGITSPLFFDLSSPLTLIYAPNGTGKTTVCEAVEWLLTGQVERLTDSQGFNEGILTAKFLDRKRPSTVLASIFTENLNHYVSRSADASGSKIKYGTSAETASVLDHEQWLGMLSPQDTLKGNTILPVSVLMERWIKGARFLTLEALSTLIDTDEENLERRVQIFADLLGIRHLIDAEKACENFLLDIHKSEISIARNIKIKQSEIAGLVDFQKGSIQGGLRSKVEAKLNTGLNV